MCAGVAPVAETASCLGIGTIKSSPRDRNSADVYKHNLRGDPLDWTLLMCMSIRNPRGRPTGLDSVDGNPAVV